MTKLPISQYPKETSPVVLLWNDDWSNPVVGNWIEGGFYMLLEDSRIVGVEGWYEHHCLEYPPTHFTYLTGDE